MFEPMLRAALAEDLGRAGDITSTAIVPADQVGEAVVVARAPGRLAGVEMSLTTFDLLDPRVRWDIHRNDGHEAAKDDVIAVVRGPGRALLSGERTMLNLLGHLCGIATATSTVVALVAPYRAQVVCTRKTTPGLRALEKYAVRCGGGGNHRFGLDDAVLIKDNHVALAGGVRPAIERARAYAGHLVKVECEVDGLAQLEEALAAGADVVLLDNFELDELRAAVSMCRGRAVTEASGGITPGTAAAVASTGVDLLSMGWLTHSAPNLDVAFDIRL